MGVDWSIVFEGAKTVLNPLSNASWPIAVGVIAWTFRQPIKSMIDRVRQLSGFGGTVNLTASDALIPMCIDQYPCAQCRSPMDMMRQG